MLVGLFKTIQRVLISAAVNLFYLCRLDTALTIKGWEWLDKGTQGIAMHVCVVFNLQLFVTLVLPYSLLNMSTARQLLFNVML